MSDIGDEIARDMIGAFSRDLPQHAMKMLRYLREWLANADDLKHTLFSPNATKQCALAETLYRTMAKNKGNAIDKVAGVAVETCYFASEDEMQSHMIWLRDHQLEAYSSVENIGPRFDQRASWTLTGNERPGADGVYCLYVPRRARAEAGLRLPSALHGLELTEYRSFLDRESAIRIAANRKAAELCRFSEEDVPKVNLVEGAKDNLRVTLKTTENHRDGDILLDRLKANNIPFVAHEGPESVTFEIHRDHAPIVNDLVRDTMEHVPGVSVNRFEGLEELRKVAFHGDKPFVQVQTTNQTFTDLAQANVMKESLAQAGIEYESYYDADIKEETVTYSMDKREQLIDSISSTLEKFQAGELSQETIARYVTAIAPEQLSYKMQDFKSANITGEGYKQHIKKDEVPSVAKDIDRIGRNNPDINNPELLRTKDKGGRS